MPGSAVGTNRIVNIENLFSIPSSDSDDYGNSEDDDFNNILRESMSVQSFQTTNTNPFSKKDTKKKNK